MEVSLKVYEILCARIFLKQKEENWGNAGLAGGAQRTVKPKSWRDLFKNV